MSWVSINFDPVLRSGSPDLYRIAKIPKPGGYRIIEEPCEGLKKIQREVVLPILEQFPVHPAAHSVKSKSAADNAQIHVDSKIVITMDIKDFFPSVHKTNVLTGLLFSDPELTSQVIGLLDYCLIRDDHRGYYRLPQGAPTSPLLSTLAFSHIDTELDLLAKTNELSYSRYIDDLTFSGDVRPRKFVKNVSDIVGSNGYKLNHCKTNSFHRSYQRQQVTGVVVNEKRSVPRKRRKLLRAKLDHIARKGLELDEETRGELSYVYSINPEQYDTLMRNYERRKERYRRET